MQCVGGLTGFSNKRADDSHTIKWKKKKLDFIIATYLDIV